MKFADWVDVWNNSIVCTEQWQCAKWRFIFVTYYWIWTVCFWYEFVDYTNHVVSDILMEECDAVFNGPAKHIQLTQKHFSIYEQWPVKCCGVHSWHYLSSKTDSSCVSVYVMCCSVEVLQLFYRKHLMTFLTLLILFAGSTSKTVMRDIKAFFCNVLHLRCTYFCTLLIHAGYLLKEWLRSFSPISPDT